MNVQKTIQYPPQQPPAPQTGTPQQSAPFVPSASQPPPQPQQPPATQVVSTQPQPVVVPAQLPPTSVPPTISSSTAQPIFGNIPQPQFVSASASQAQVNISQNIMTSVPIPQAIPTVVPQTQHIPSSVPPTQQQHIVTPITTPLPPQHDIQMQVSVYKKIMELVKL